MKSELESNFDRFIGLLSDQLKFPLPGKDSQYLMAPEKNKREERFSNIPHSIKKAGILILLYAKENAIKTVLIERTDYGGVHSKQISFPGGKNEKNDKDMFATACRETDEEIGIPCSAVNIIGKLSDLYIPPSNFLVSPFVAYIKNALSFKADPSEVQNIIELDLSLLLNDKFITEMPVCSAANINIIAPCFYISDVVIWGATAMIISELKTIINRIPESSSIIQL